MRSPAQLTDAFRRNGLKVTPQRELVFRILYGNDSHPTADAVHAVARDAMPTISLKTVYQVLNDLASLGELQLLDVGTGAVRFDPNVDGHQHLVCTSCGAVRDVTVACDLTVPADLAQGFEVASADVIFRGTCAACRS